MCHGWLLVCASDMLSPCIRVTACRWMNPGCCHSRTAFHSPPSSPLCRTCSALPCFRLLPQKPPPPPPYPSTPSLPLLLRPIPRKRRLRLMWILKLRPRRPPNSHPPLRLILLPTRLLSPHRAIETRRKRRMESRTSNAARASLPPLLTTCRFLQLCGLAHTTIIANLSREAQITAASTFQPSCLPDPAVYLCQLLAAPARAAWHLRAQDGRDDRSENDKRS